MEVQAFMDESGGFNGQTHDHLLIIGLGTPASVPVTVWEERWARAWEHAGMRVPPWQDFHAVTSSVSKQSLIRVAGHLLGTLEQRGVIVRGVYMEQRPGADSDVYLDFLLQTVTSLVAALPPKNEKGGIALKWHIARRENLDMAMLATTLQNRVAAMHRRGEIANSLSAVDIHVYDVNLHPLLVCSDLLCYAARTDRAVRARAGLAAPGAPLSPAMRQALRGRGPLELPGAAELGAWLEEVFAGETALDMAALRQRLGVPVQRLGLAQRLHVLDGLLEVAARYVDVERDDPPAEAVLLLVGALLKEPPWISLIPEIELERLRLACASCHLAIRNHRGLPPEPLPDISHLWLHSPDTVAEILNRDAVGLSNIFAFTEALDRLTPVLDSFSDRALTFEGEVAFSPALGRLAGTAGQLYALLAHGMSPAGDDPARADDHLERATRLLELAAVCFTDPRDIERQETYRIHLAVERFRLGRWSAHDACTIVTEIGQASSATLLETFCSDPLHPSAFHSAFRVWALLKARRLTGLSVGALDVQAVASAFSAALRDEPPGPVHPLPLIAAWLLAEDALPAGVRAPLLALEAEAVAAPGLIGFVSAILRAARLVRSGEPLPDIQVPAEAAAGWARAGYAARLEAIRAAPDADALLALLPFNLC